MSFGISQFSPLLRTAIGFDDADHSSRRPNRSNEQRSLESTFAIGRALVAVSLPLMMGLELFGSAAMLSPGFLTSIYSLYAVSLILLFITIAHKPVPYLVFAVHTADVFWACAFSSFLPGDGPATLFFVFPLLTSALRWGSAATLATTFVMAGILQAAHVYGIAASYVSRFDPFETSASVVLAGVLFAFISHRYTRSVALSTPAIRVEPRSSGGAIQIIECILGRLCKLLKSRQVQLLMEESTTGRIFLWRVDGGDSTATVHSEEFDCSSADAHLSVMPKGNWIVHGDSPEQKLLMVGSDGKKRVRGEDIPEAFRNHFRSFRVVVSAAISLDDEWHGRIIVCDPAPTHSKHVALSLLTEFGNTAAGSLYSALSCLRACRETAAEERARIARELHDGVIQSLLAAELRLERIRRRADPLESEDREEIHDLQRLLRTEASGLRDMISDARPVLSPDRLPEYLAQLLERFQLESGIVTRFLADLDNDQMPPRLCHELGRIVEESLVNVRKHSRASSVAVRLTFQARSWVLVIVDDGIGFGFTGSWSLEKLLASGKGPRVIKERVRSIKGGLLLESSPAGARLEITISRDGIRNGHLSEEYLTS